MTSVFKIVEGVYRKKHSRKGEPSVHLISANASSDYCGDFKDCLASETFML